MTYLEKVFSDKNLYEFTNYIIPKSEDSKIKQIAKYVFLSFTLFIPIAVTAIIDWTKYFFTIDSEPKAEELRPSIGANPAALLQGGAAIPVQVPLDIEKKTLTNTFMEGFKKSMFFTYSKQQKIAKLKITTDAKITLLAGSVLGSVLLFGTIGRFCNGKGAIILSSLLAISGIFSDQIVTPIKNLFPEDF